MSTFFLPRVFQPNLCEHCFYQGFCNKSSFSLHIHYSCGFFWRDAIAWLASSLAHRNEQGREGELCFSLLSKFIPPAHFTHSSSGTLGKPVQIAWSNLIIPFSGLWLSVYNSSKKLLQPVIHNTSLLIGSSEGIMKAWTCQRQRQHGFSGIARDQTMEQTFNRDSKVKGGIVGFTLNRSAVHRWIMAQSERGAITQKCYEMAGLENKNR